MPSRDKASFKVGWNSDNIFLKTINADLCTRCKETSHRIRQVFSLISGSGLKVVKSPVTLKNDFILILSSTEVAEFPTLTAMLAKHVSAQFRRLMHTMDFCFSLQVRG